MHRQVAWAIPWLLAVALAALLTRGITAQDGNLLVNGGFEEGAEGWRAVRGDLSDSDALLHGGFRAGVFVTTSAGAEIGQCLPVAPGGDYEFLGYAARREGDLVSTLRLNVLWRDRDNCQGQFVGTKDSPLAMLDEAEHWFELAFWDTAPGGVRSVYLTVLVEETGATVYLDDFAASGPAAPAETPTLEPSPWPSASPSPQPTSDPHFTPTATATAEPPSPSTTPHPPPSPPPHVSPTASSWQMTPVAPPSAVQNGGFEEADAEGVPSSWRKWGGRLTRTGAMYFEGQFAAAFASETSSTKWAYQVVTVQGGKAYVLSAYALKDDTAVAGAYLRLSWYASPDGSGQAIDSADSTERLIDDVSEFRLLTTGAVVAPDDAVSAKARLMLDPVGEAPATAYFDSVTFEETVATESAASPTAAASPIDDADISTPLPSPLAESASATPSGPRNASSPPASAIRVPSSPTPAHAANNGAPAVLGATRNPVPAARAEALTTVQAQAAVYRQPKPGPLLRDATAGRLQSEDGVSPQLLALAIGIPALAAAGAGAGYWQWRRARLR